MITHNIDAPTLGTLIGAETQVALRFPVGR
jgi:hypothetical protein